MVVLKTYTRNNPIKKSNLCKGPDKIFVDSLLQLWLTLIPVSPGSLNVQNCFWQLRSPRRPTFPATHRFSFKGLSLLKMSFLALILLIPVGFKEGSHFRYQFNTFRLPKRKSRDNRFKCSQPLLCLLGYPKEGSEN